MSPTICAFKEALRIREVGGYDEVCLLFLSNGKEPLCNRVQSPCDPMRVRFGRLKRYGTNFVAVNTEVKSGARRNATGMVLI